MTRDPIIEEIHAIREQLAKQYDNDLQKIADAIAAEEGKDGWEVVSRPPKRISKQEP